MTVSWEAITLLLDWCRDKDEIPIRADQRIQILPDFEDLGRARVHQCAAFIANENILVVWDDEPSKLITRAQTLVDDLVKLTWETPKTFTQTAEKQAAFAVTELSSPSPSERNSIDGNFDVEKTAASTKERPYIIYNAVYVSITLAIIILFIGFGIRTLLVEAIGDGKYLRFAALLFTPVQVFFSLFFFQVLVGCFAQTVGPVKQMTQNSRFYSGLKPKRITGGPLPHVTM